MNHKPAGTDAPGRIPVVDAYDGVVIVLDAVWRLQPLRTMDDLIAVVALQLRAAVAGAAREARAIPSRPPSAPRAASARRAPHATVAPASRGTACTLSALHGA